MIWAIAKTTELACLRTWVVFAQIATRVRGLAKDIRKALGTTRDIMYEPGIRDTFKKAVGTRKMKTTIKLYALAYAKKNWRVFALTPMSKIPLIGTNGCKDATVDQRRIAKWANNINIGIATGTISNIVVVDVDTETGQRSLYAWFASHERFPDTPVALTPRGQHIYFSYPAEHVGCKVDVAPGIDIRATGGYVVAPPSVCDTGSYSWHPRGQPGMVPLAPMPGWLLEILRPVKRPARAPRPAFSGDRGRLVARCRAYLARIQPAVEGRGGDDATYRVAAIGGDFDLDDAEFWPLLCEWNQRCVPPWDENGLRAKLAHAGKYRKEPRGFKQ